MGGRVLEPSHLPDLRSPEAQPLGPCYMPQEGDAVLGLPHQQQHQHQHHSQQPLHQQPQGGDGQAEQGPGGAISALIPPQMADARSNAGQHGLPWAQTPNPSGGPSASPLAEDRPSLGGQPGHVMIHGLLPVLAAQGLQGAASPGDMQLSLFPGIDPRNAPGSGQDPDPRGGAYAGHTYQGSPGRGAFQESAVLATAPEASALHGAHKHEPMPPSTQDHQQARHQHEQKIGEPADKRPYRAGELSGREEGRRGGAARAGSPRALAPRQQARSSGQGGGAGALVPVPLAGPARLSPTQASQPLSVGPAPSPSNASLSTSRGRRCAKRDDLIWAAHFFFTHYYEPAIKDKSKEKLRPEHGGWVGRVERSDLVLEEFLVQHDMENCYMYAFRHRPQNALGKMQLRSYMNGHSRFGEPQFPFSVECGFQRSHRMQRKRYKGLSNPQCIHGVRPVRHPDLSRTPELDISRWQELTGQEGDLSMGLAAEEYSEWRVSQTPQAHDTTEREDESWDLRTGSCDNLSDLGPGAAQGQGQGWNRARGERERKGHDPSHASASRQQQQGLWALGPGERESETEVRPSSSSPAWLGGRGVPRDAAGAGSRLPHSQSHLAPEERSQRHAKRLKGDEGGGMPHDVVIEGSARGGRPTHLEQQERSQRGRGLDRAGSSLSGEGRGVGASTSVDLQWRAVSTDAYGAGGASEGGGLRSRSSRPGQGSLGSEDTEVAALRQRQEREREFRDILGLGRTPSQRLGLEENVASVTGTQSQSHGLGPPVTASAGGGGGEASQEGSKGGPALREVSEDNIQPLRPPPWLAECYGVLTQTSGPVTCAKSVYEDDKGYLVVVSLPFTDPQRLRVTWRNSLSQGIVKVQCSSVTRAPCITRWERTFRLTDPSPELCPPGDFVREITLPSRIPDSADVKAFFTDAGAGVEILVPKQDTSFHEREVQLFVPLPDAAPGQHP